MAILTLHGNFHIKKVFSSKQGENSQILKGKNFQMSQFLNTNVQGFPSYHTLNDYFHTLR